MYNYTLFNCNSGFFKVPLVGKADELFCTTLTRGRKSRVWRRADLRPVPLLNFVVLRAQLTFLAGWSSCC